MKMMLRVWVPLVLCLGMMGGAWAQQASAGGDAVWTNDLAARRVELIKRNGPGTDAALRDELTKMVASDQEARGAGTGHPMYTAKTAAVDVQLTTELKGIVARHGWPTIAMVGFDASNGAMTILTHTKDHVWQRSMLPKLEKLAGEGKIDGSALATVVDKELVSEGRPQRYGTQFKFVEGNSKIAMIAVEDPAGLDARRAMVFLMPINEYEQMLEKGYHVQLSDQIVSAGK
jgi:hypothetical protein